LLLRINMSKIVQKYIVNSINSFYLDAIKQHCRNNTFQNLSVEELICTHEIYGKKINFYLSCIKSTDSNFEYKIGAYYYPKQIKRKYKILITLNIFDGFSEKCFSDLYFRIKACLIHEIEHHLQRRKAPNREFLPMSNFKPYSLEYINSPSELEACLKHLYFSHKKTGTNFSKLLIEEANLVSEDESLQDLFISNITHYMISRKDLNLFEKITF